MKRTPLRKVSRKRAGELKLYAALRGTFLQQHPFCQVIGCYPGPSTEIHHRNGRNGKRLLNTDKFIAVCRACHRKIHDNPRWAREQGLLT